ncbi:mucin-17-like isoform X2 [Acanthaster planci]|uniref:Mucin-17-like isoform X2 n=1 Tax=Acanthaster planci TaxID=133434 RepID=A0A8B7XY91_ACAPL|nr:mucin-17-like isoform X2 [Acanthaster planci]
MDEHDDESTHISYPVIKSAAQVLHNDVVAQLKPMFPHLLENTIRESVVRQSRLLADPLDQNRLTNSCIDDLLCLMTAEGSTRNEQRVFRDYIDLTDDSFVHSTTANTEVVINLDVTPDCLEIDTPIKEPYQAKEDVEVDHNIRDAPSPNLNCSDSSQLASDKGIGLKSKPEVIQVSHIDVQLLQSSAKPESPRGQAVLEGRSDSLTVPSEATPVNSSVSMNGTVASFGTASKQGSPLKVKIKLDQASGLYKVQNETSDIHSSDNGTAVSHHHQKPSQAPSTMSRCPCLDCQTLPTPETQHSSDIFPPSRGPLEEWVNPLEEPAPSTSTSSSNQTLGHKDSQSTSSQSNSVTGNPSTATKHSTVQASTSSRTEERCPAISESPAMNPGVLEAKERRQSLGTLTTGSAVQDEVRKDTATKKNPPSSGTLEEFFSSLLSRAQGRSSTPSKPGAGTSCVSRPSSTPIFSSSAAAKCQQSNSDRHRGSAVPVSNVGLQTTPRTTLQPSTSATSVHSHHGSLYAATNCSQTYTQRLYKKPANSMQPATSLTSTSHTIPFGTLTQPAEATGSNLSSSTQPALGASRTIHRSPSLESLPKSKTQAAVKQVDQGQASSSYHRLSGLGSQKLVPSQSPSTHQSFDQSCQKKTISGTTNQTNASKPPLSASAPSQGSTRHMTYTSVSTRKPTQSSQVETTDPDAIHQQTTVKTTPFTPVPTSQPKVSNQCMQGHVPPPFVPNPQPQPALHQVTDPLPPATFWQPQTQRPPHVTFGSIPPPNATKPQPQAVRYPHPLPFLPQAIVSEPQNPPPFVPVPKSQPMIQTVTYPMPPAATHQPQIQPTYPATQIQTLPSIPNPEPQPETQPVTPVPLQPPVVIHQPHEVLPEQKNRPGNDRTIEEMKSEVLMLFPEVDPSYILTQLQAMKDYPSPVNVVCNHLLENPSYPRAKKQEAPSTSKSVKTKVEEEKVDYIKDYYKMPASRRYAEDIMIQLQNDFRMLSVDTIRMVWSLHFFNYAPTRVCLEEILRSNERIQKLLPQVKTLSHQERKIQVKITTKNLQGKQETTKVVIHLLKGLRHPFYQGNIKASSDLQRQLKFYQEYVKNSSLEKDLMLALSLNENEYEAEGQLIECGCCFAEVTFETMVQCLDGHLFCDSCLQRYAKESVYGQGKAHLTCMTDGCDSSYPRDQLEKCLSANDMAKYDERVQEESIQLAGMDGLVRCPHCDFAAVLDPGDKVFSCQNTDCMKETCRHCGEDWKDHFGKRCEEIEKKSETNMRLSYEERMSQAQIRTCHRCKAGIMKDQGCNKSQFYCRCQDFGHIMSSIASFILGLLNKHAKMTCRCGAKMCYICRKPDIDYNHFCGHARNPGQGCTVCTKCSLWTDPAEDDARAVKELEKELQMQKEKLARVRDSRDHLALMDFAPEAKKPRVI